MTTASPRDYTGSQRLEEETILQVLSSAARGLGGVLGPTCEVVVHDLRKPQSSIVAIVNGYVSGRRLGGPLIGGPVNDLALKWITSSKPQDSARDYLTQTKDGRTLKSSSVLYRDDLGKPFAAFCVNLDLTVPSIIKQWADGMLNGPAPIEPEKSNQEKTDVDAVLDEIISECLTQLSLPPASSTKEDRYRVISALDERGAFLIKGAVRRVAKELGVSKFTVYSYLDELRRDNQPLSGD